MKKDSSARYLEDHEDETGDFSDCVLCKHKAVNWDEEPCASCHIDNKYEPVKER